MSFKKDLELAKAEEVALDFLAKTKDLYRRSLLAGSIRRKQPIVHDIDFAVIPKGKSFSAWKGRVTDRVVEIGGQVATFGEVISSFRYRGVQINLFICPNPDAWGVTQMWATGPKGHTIGMTIKARNKGLTLNSQGLWTRDSPPRLIRTDTEQEVGRLLDWKYKPPEARGKGSGKGTGKREVPPVF
jgi:DNA polymerase/3'-5' exonuclease PolX